MTDRTPGRKRPPLKVAARPAWTVTNPYPTLFAEALQAEGAEVIEMPSSPLRYPFKSRVVLFHWPDEFFLKGDLRQMLRWLLLVICMSVSKALGRQKFVWTVHNIVPHATRHAPFDLGRRLFFRYVDGLIFLSAASRELLLERFPELRSKAYLVIAHGHYKESFIKPPTPLALKAGAAMRIAYIGQVQRYKAPDLLVKIVRTLPVELVSLTVAGSCPETEFAGELETLAKGVPNVTLDLKRLSDAEIEDLVDSSDAIVLPYRNILNSGSVLFALSRARPVLAPRLGSLVELQQAVGEDWLHLYDGELDAGKLTAFLDWLQSAPRRPEPDLSSQDWDRIGGRAAEFLGRL